MNRRTLFLLFLTATISGCAAIGRKKNMNKLDPTLSAYTGAIRWGNVETAASFARPRDGRDPDTNMEAMHGLKITGYKIRINRINEAADEASVSFSFTYYHEDRASIRQVEQKTTWYFSASDNTWYLDGTLPDFSQ